jgi:hypothetical protein
LWFEASLGNSSRDPILKIPITRKGWWSGLSSKSAYLENVEFKPWCCQKKKKKEEEKGKGKDNECNLLN